MAIIHADNFSVYGTTQSLLTQGVYVETSGIGLLATDPDGVSGGRVLECGALDNIRYSFPSGEAAVIGIAWRAWATALPANDVALNSGLYLTNAGNSPLCYVGITSNGRARVYLQDASNVRQTYNSAAPVVGANGWWHYEFRYERTGTNTCDFELRVEGQTVLTQTGVSCRAFDPAQTILTGFGELSSLPETGFYKDLVIWDDTSSYNNDFLGSVLVTNLQPASDVALNWTPSTGTDGYSILDNIPPNDAQYIQAGDPPPSPYVASLTNLPPDVTSVKALITMVRAAKSDGGDGSLQAGLISNGDTVLGADRPITTSQTYWMDVFQTDPDTSAPWLPVAVDAANLQLDRTT